MADAPKLPAFPPHSENMTVRDAAIQCGGSNVYATTKGGGSETCLACGETIAEFNRVVCINGSMWFHMDCLNHPASITPSSAARVLLSDPEAMERMVEAMTKIAAERDGRDWSKAIIREVYSPRYAVEAREMALNALRAIAGEEAP